MTRLWLTTGQRLRDIFLDKGEVNPWLAYQELRSSEGLRGSYQHVLRLFYACRAVGLIAFSYEGKSSIAPINKRYHIIIPGCEKDPRWFSPYAELYPSSALGGLRYVKGSSQGRKTEYERTQVL